MKIGPYVIAAAEVMTMYNGGRKLVVLKERRRAGIRRIVRGREVASDVERGPLSL